MTILKKGITGFGSETYISENDIRVFIKRFRYPFIPDFKNALPPSPSSNFWRIPFVNKNDNSEFDMLINSSYWNLALITKDSSWMNHEYLNFPQELYLQIKSIPGPELPMNREILERTLDNEELHELDKTEIEEIKGWESQTVGEVIFNGYD